MAVDERRSFSSPFMTKTQHYRKITKPLLERKRRARMNLYIDELKDLIVDTMEAQGEHEHVAKWEKADILEMTVNYLKMQRHKNIQNQNNESSSSTMQADNNQSSNDGGGVVNLEKFRAGYTQAAYDVSKIFATLPGLDLKFTTRLMQHLGGRLKDIPEKQEKRQEQKQQPRQQNDTKTTANNLIYEHNTTTPTLKQQQQQYQTHHNYQQRHIEPQKALQLKQEIVWRPW